MATKYVYYFGDGDAEGDESMRLILGGKGATASDNNFVGGGNDIVTTDISEDPFKDFASEVALSDDDLPF